jgi:hypothetical protein
MLENVPAYGRSFQQVCKKDLPQKINALFIRCMPDAEERYNDLLQTYPSICTAGTTNISGFLPRY